MPVAFVAAAIAVASATLPAEAVTFTLNPNLGLEVVTRPTTQSCPLMQACSPISGAPFSQYLPLVSFNVPALAGTFTFDQEFGPNSNLGLFTVMSSVTFSSDGILLGSVYNFTFDQIIRGNPSCRTMPRDMCSGRACCSTLSQS